MRQGGIPPARQGSGPDRFDRPLSRQEITLRIQAAWRPLGGFKSAHPHINRRD
jgi:hypothetical protein